VGCGKSTECDRVPLRAGSDLRFRQPAFVFPARRRKLDDEKRVDQVVCGAEAAALSSTAFHPSLTIPMSTTPDITTMARRPTRCGLASHHVTDVEISDADRRSYDLPVDFVVVADHVMVRVAGWAGDTVGLCRISRFHTDGASSYQGRGRCADTILRSCSELIPTPVSSLRRAATMPAYLPLCDPREGDPGHRPTGRSPCVHMRLPLRNAKNTWTHGSSPRTMPEMKRSSLPRGPLRPQRSVEAI